MPAHKLNAISGVGRRVSAFGLYAVPGDLPAIAMYSAIQAICRAWRWHLPASAIKQSTCKHIGCQAMAGGGGWQVGRERSGEAGGRSEADRARAGRLE